MGILLVISKDVSDHPPGQIVKSISLQFNQPPSII
jgi:hypothetical protein